MLVFLVPCLFCNNYPLGTYACSSCGAGLFSSLSKYAHDTPWPAFSKTLTPDALKKEVETEPQESSDCKALKVEFVHACIHVFDA